MARHSHSHSVVHHATSSSSRLSLGRPLVRGIPNTYLIGGGAVAAIATYFVGRQFFGFPDLLSGLFGPPAAAPAALTQGPTAIDLNPTMVLPGTPVSLQGDLSKTPAPTYFTVFRSRDGAKMTNGTLPNSQFVNPISTAGFQDGDYQVVISDSPVVSPPGGITGTASGIEPPPPIRNYGAPFPGQAIDPNLIQPSITQMGNELGGGSQSQSNLTFSRFARVTTA